MSRATFIDAELLTLQALNPSSPDYSSQLTFVLGNIKHKLKCKRIEDVNNFLAIACSLAHCNETMSSYDADVWAKDALDDIGTST